MDLKTDPDLLAEAVNRFADVNIPSAIAQAKMMHAKYAFIPLHVGIDEFMSPDDYHDYYWPPLKRLLDELIKNEITPMVMCEGNYYTRLETLKEIQKGKVVYFFEKQDMKKAKDALSGIACIAAQHFGNVPVVFAGALEGTPDAEALSLIELLKADEGTEVLASYGHYAWKDYAAITRHAFGEGTAEWIGTLLAPDAIRAVMREAVSAAGIESAGDALAGTVTVRQGVNEAGETVTYLLNYSAEPVTFASPVAGEVVVAPATIATDGTVDPTVAFAGAPKVGDKVEAGADLTVGPWNLAVVVG